MRRGDTKSCGCLGKSLGQDIIRNILIKNNISFETEFKFDDLKDKSCLRFDFALFDENEKLKKLIEFDGR